jgi:hypothetical protein
MWYLTLLLIVSKTKATKATKDRTLCFRRFLYTYGPKNSLTWVNNKEQRKAAGDHPPTACSINLNICSPFLFLPAPVDAIIDVSGSGSN